MKKFWKTKRFWVTFMAVVAAVVSGVIDDQQLREGILAAVTAAITGRMRIVVSLLFFVKCRLQQGKCRGFCRVSIAPPGNVLLQRT